MWFGKLRAIWALDGIAPLRQLATAFAGQPAAEPRLLASAPAVRLRANQNRDTPLPPEEPRAPNPPVGALIDYLVPADCSAPLALEIADAAGRVVRRWASDAPAERPAAEPYFAPLWRGAPAPLRATPGHHRFVWDLRRSPPRVLHPEWSMAALPGRPMTALPQGAFVVPGDYEVRLIAGQRTLRQPLRVLADPRVASSSAELAALI